MIRAISLFSLASLAAAVFGVATNKIIALMAGTEGMARLGIYRNLAALVTGLLSLGYGTIFLQRLSNARTKQSVVGVIDAALLLLAMQTAGVLFLMTFSLGILDRWMFGGGAAGNHSVEIAIVLAMSLVQLFFQSANALVKAQTKVEAITVVQFVTAAAGLALIYPLLRLGPTGLAWSVGAGAAGGAATAGYFVRKFYLAEFDGFSPEIGWRFLRGTAASSLILSMTGIVLMGTHLHIQSILGRTKGMAALGNYNAALLIIGTAVMVLMSAARTYILPHLGKLEDEKEKRAEFSRVLGLSLVALTLGGLALILGSGFLIPLLFSSKFEEAALLLPVLCLSLPGQAYGWNYNTYMVHKGDFGTTFILDSAWCLLFVGGTAVCLRRGLPISSVAWTYAASYCGFGLFYALVGGRKYGTKFLSAENVRLTGVCLALLCLGYAISRQGSIPLSLGFFAVSAASVAISARKSSFWAEFNILFRRPPPV